MAASEPAAVDAAPSPFRRPFSVASVISVACLSAAAASAALLPNELPGDRPLAVAVRGAAGPYFRPGAWMVLKVTIENPGEPFLGAVRVRETRGGRETFFVGAERTELRRGTNSLDILVAPGGPAAGSSLEIVRLDNDGAAGEVVFRGDLWRILNPLGADERLVLGVGLRAFPAQLAPDSAVWSVDPRGLPARTEAYAAVDLVVIEDARRHSVSGTQASALLEYLRGGGTVTLASFRALDALRLSGAATVSDFPATVWATDGDAAHWYGRRRVGKGWLHVFPAEVGDVSAWRFQKELVRYLDEILRRERPSPWIDTAAFDALAPERPFARAASRARVVVIVGALIATVAVALLLKTKRRVAAAGIAGATVAWTVVAMMVWQKPAGAARIVRVRAFTADGRAEIVTDTAALVAFDREVDLAFETETGPALPVARRAGGAFKRAFILKEVQGAWALSSLRCAPGEVTLVRAVSVRAPGPDSRELMERVLARGDRARVTELSSGRRRIEPVAGELSPLVRYLLDRFALPALRAGVATAKPPRGGGGEEIAWAWVDGAPEGAVAPGTDASPGSGTLLVAAVRRAP